MDATESVVKPKAKKPKITPFLYLATVASSLGMFQCGYSLWIVHIPAANTLEFPNTTFQALKLQEDDLKYDDQLLAVPTMMFPIGALFGVLLLGFILDKWGRNRILFVSNCANIASAALLGYSRSWHLYKIGNVGRLINGMSSGMFSCVVPLYIAEISPPCLRGALHMVSTLFMTLGVLVAQLLGLYKDFRNRDGLLFLLGLVGVMAIISMVLLQFVPESPRFLLIQKRKETEAKKALKKLRQNDMVEEEMEELQQEDLFEKAEKGMNAAKLLCFPELRWHVIDVAILMAGNQLTGIHGVYFYAERIYKSLGIDSKYLRFMLIGVNTGLHLVTLLGMLSIDLVGRRFLLLIGFMTCSMICVLLAVFLELQVQNNPSLAYFSMMIVILFLAAQMVGPAPIPYLLTGELFLQSARGSAYVIGGFINWLTRFLTGAVFTRIEPLIGPYSLLLFWPVTIFIFVYIFKMIPETKDRTFVEIRKAMDTHRRKKEHRKKKAKSTSFH